MLVTIAINKKLNRNKSFLKIKLIIELTNEIKMIILNHFCPDFNSSDVIFDKYIPIGNPKIKTNIPINNLIISCI